MRKLAPVLAVLLASVAATTANVVPASAGATVLRGTTESPISATGLTDDCRPGITGELSGTEVVNFNSVETAKGFSVSGTTTDTDCT